MKTKTAPTDDDDGGPGGDEPFCQHGNLLWSEDCDDCDDELMKVSNGGKD